MKDQLEAGYVVVSEDAQSVLGGVAQVLEYYSLTPNQIRVYLQLARWGPQTATQVALRVGCHRTESHKTLHELEALGLISRAMSWPSLYTALSFRDAVGLLWRERRRTLDSVELMSDALAAAFERMPRKPSAEPSKTSFTRYSKNGTYRSKIEKLSGSSSRCLFYLREDARRHLDQIVEGPTSNEAHPELGSFAVFDDSVFLLRRDSLGEWSALEIRMPEIAEAYALLFTLLEGEP